MPALVAVDPSVSKTGVAIFRNGALVRAFFVGIDPGNPLVMARLVERAVRAWCDAHGENALHLHLVIEEPQIYEHGKKAPDRDILELCAAAYAIVGRLDVTYTAYTPAGWKKQIKKEMVVERVQKRLSLDELRAVELPPALSVQHNVWEAIGLGLVHLRRWTP